MLLLMMLSASVKAQMFITRNAKVTFFSKSAMENIEAVNNEATSVFNASKNEFGFVVLVRSFKFKKAQMEEHFNEDYMESNTYPKAFFKGLIVDAGKLKLTADGSYPVSVKGDMSIHGISKNIEVPGVITVSQGIVSISAKFNIKLKDYNIKIPSTVINNVAEVINITVNAKYEVYKKS